LTQKICTLSNTNTSCTSSNLTSFISHTATKNPERQTPQHLFNNQSTYEHIAYPLPTFSLNPFTDLPTCDPIVLSTCHVFSSEATTAAL
jgi:hypothetical protein